MAYNPHNLSVLSYANGFTLWHYTTMDAVVAVEKTGYFNKAAGMLRVGDMITTNVDTAGVPGGCILLVAGNVGGCVSVRNLTPDAAQGVAVSEAA